MPLELNDLSLVQSLSGYANKITDSAVEYGAAAWDNVSHGIAPLSGNVSDMLWTDLASIVASLTGITIHECPTFMERNYGYMSRLMMVNHIQHNAILGGEGNDIPDTFEGVTANAHIPVYAQKSNYLAHALGIPRDEADGIDTPRQQRQVGADGSPYTSTENLYYDERNVGTFSDKIQVGNMQSIVAKTKRLFNQRKIKTIISAFGTAADNGGDSGDFTGSQATAYGLSHGKNLLTKAAEDDGRSYAINGYQNPYCRVWTHHHMYDRYTRVIRPFVNDSEENSNDSSPLTRFHDWSKGDSRWGNNDKDSKKDFAWKNGDNPGWARSVLNNSTGLPNIAPHYNPGDSKTNIETKNVMLSIENLAWKDYDPFAFEKTLSWEQRGPMGGRIMWFPPYGISFNESTRTEWNANTFIGRGEDVFTYTKTQRTGTLRFMMVVDHPSILDYVTWTSENMEGANVNVKDTDVYRFFAGCDAGQGTVSGGSGSDGMSGSGAYSLVNFARPTPLTDEFVGKPEEQLATETKAKKKKPKDGEVPGATKSVTFCVFYPNNYSGYFDEADFAIGYLLGGRNAQMTTEVNQNNTITEGNWSNIPISFKDFTASGKGYEMDSNAGVTDKKDNEQVYGKLDGSGRKWANHKGKVFTTRGDRNHDWWYRIDGTYIPPKGKDSTKRDIALNLDANNTYDELINESSYLDNTSYGLNSKYDNAIHKEIFNADYTLSEVAQVVAEMKGYTQIKEYLKGVNSGFEQSKRYTDLVSLFKDEDKLDVEASFAYGIASAYNPSGKRNQNLAEHRGDTVARWLHETMGWDIQTNVPDDKKVQYNSSEQKQELKEPKKYRCAVCKLVFKTSDTKPASQGESNDEYIVDNTLFTKMDQKQNVNGKEVDCYQDRKGQIWVDMGDKMVKLEKIMTPGNPRAYIQEGKSVKTQNVGLKEGPGLGEYNKYRYDQEYHFFKQMQTSSPFIWKKFTDKLQYFDPVFHAMTPEGFNARLTFLQQCTRQGDTISMSGPNAQTASNMAFGRPPFCILRLGDFYNQMVVINNININYDVSQGINWDMNTEGIGVQPMLCEVNLDFTFIGGGDMGGAVRRLQNACSFNYYANASLYDNRADRVKYKDDAEHTHGFGEMDTESTY